MSYKIIYKRKECIGAAECEALSPDIWKVDKSGKAVLKDAVLNEQTGFYELEITDEQYKKQNLVAGSCPAGCILITKV